MLLGLALSANVPAAGAAEVDEETGPPLEKGDAAPKVDATEAQAEEIEAHGGAVGVSPGAAQGIEEIVVQARKRAELLEDTPLSVTAINEDLLRETGVTRLDEIKNLVPNLQIRTGRGGQDAIIQIRGIGTASGEVVFDPAVGIYVDGVFLPRSLGGLIDVVDIEQVEVLRGPQGTLFGKNTVGGAISITTVKPKPDLEALAFIRVGNFDRIDSRVVLNVPLLDERLFGRFAFATTNAEGYTNNTFRNEDWSDRNGRSYLGSLRWLPADNLIVDVSGTWSRTDTHSKGGECRFVQETDLLALYPGYREACERSRPFKFQANTDSIFDIESYGFWGTVRWDIGDLGPLRGLELKSITSWREQIPGARNDLDMTELPVLQFSLIEGGPMDSDRAFQQQHSQELQLNGYAWEDRLAFVGGAFGFWENADAPFVTFSQPTLELPPGTPLEPVDFLSRTQTDNWNWALYSQATADLTEWLSLTAGVRYTQEKKGVTHLNQNRAEPDEPSDPSSGSKIYTAWTPMASLSVRATEGLLSHTSLDHLMGYFTYGRGFRGGGFNAVVNPFATSLEPFEPEFLDSFEIGAKTVSFQRRLMANLSLFLGKYDDIQVSSLRVQTNPEDPNDIVVERLTQNAASATTKGVELELMALPIADLQLDGSLGYLDARYDSFDGAVSDLTDEPIDRSGETFNGVPKLQTHIGIQYSLPLEPPGPDWLEGWLTPRLDWSYQSALHFAGPEIEAAKQSGYNLLHARLSYAFNSDAALIALWVKNLTDETYAGEAFSIANLFGTAIRYYDPPRTFGCELSYRF